MNSLSIKMFALKHNLSGVDIAISGFVINLASYKFFFREKINYILCKVSHSEYCDSGYLVFLLIGVLLIEKSPWWWFISCYIVCLCMWERNYQRSYNILYLFSQHKIWILPYPHLQTVPRRISYVLSTEGSPFSKRASLANDMVQLDGSW